MPHPTPVNNGRQPVQTFSAVSKTTRPAILACTLTAPFVFLGLFLLHLSILSPLASTLTPADLEFFEKNIRPILIERCYECHADEKQKGGLRLDSRDAILEGGDSGPALHAGKPDDSLLFKAVEYSDPDFQMPPKNPLPPREIALLREWITRGAPDPRETSIEHNPFLSSAPSTKSTHWAYQPLAQVTPPPVQNTSWPRTELDHFILAKIEKANLSAAADADRAVLLRRIYFDLIGLPPAPGEIQSFLADSSPRAYEHLVERLLNSPHFGERWGRHWLDIARYAESVTLRGLVFKEAWRYRDYVIDSFNRDLPFDQFIREQIAGDLLDYENIADQQRARIATTYLVLGNHNYEEQDKQQLNMDIVDEQLDAIGKGLLAQTISCARCHDHKFDPIPTRDYYALAGILRNTKSVEHANVSAWLDLPLPLAAELEERIKTNEARIATLQKQIKEKTDAIAKANPAASKTSTSPASLPGVVIDDSQATLVGAWTKSQFNKPYIGAGYIHDDNQGKGAKTVTFHPALKSAGRYEVRLAYTHGANRASNLPVTILHAAGETTVTINQRKVPPLERHFVSLGQFNFEKGNQGYVLIETTGTDGHVIADAVQFLPANLPEPPGKLVSTENNELLASLKSDLEALRAELKRVESSGPKRPLVMSVREAEKIEPTRIHIRGTVHNLGPEVPRGFLQVASHGPTPTVPDTESGRRQLADWIASTNNPLTARVFVNRAWLWLFGEGLVRPPDNFGATGEQPTHPELLDYLAARFMAEGWSAKKLIRELVLSRTYQLASSASSRLEESDPENRHFARANRRPLNAESLRDSILAASGKLDLELSGPTIKPGTNADYGYIDGDFRRSIYVPAFRNALPEIFHLFDFADTSVVTGQRGNTIGAPQALYFLNNPFVLEQSRLAAQRILKIEVAARPNYASLLLLGRPPTVLESQIILQHLAHTSTDDLATWTQIIQSLLASPSFRFLN